MHFSSTEDWTFWLSVQFARRMESKSHLCSPYRRPSYSVSRPYSLMKTLMNIWHFCHKRFQWYLDGRSLDLDDVIVSHDAFSSSLSFPKLRPGHSGNYTCEASNASPQRDRTSTSLLVKGESTWKKCQEILLNVCWSPPVPPKWVVMLSDSAVRSGSTHFIKCQASGVPPPRVAWKKVEKHPQNPLENQFLDLLEQHDDPSLQWVQGNWEPDRIPWDLGESFYKLPQVSVPCTDSRELTCSV